MSWEEVHGSEQRLDQKASSVNLTWRCANAFQLTLFFSRLIQGSTACGRDARQSTSVNSEWCLARLPHFERRNKREK